MAQVTKPMALDETLQDVVTALQNITQGGHIVYSGTVGSATQPIYLNAGVPTAIGAVDVIAEGTALTSQSDLDDLVKSVAADGKTRYFKNLEQLTGVFTYKSLDYPYGAGKISRSYVGLVIIDYSGCRGWPNQNYSRHFVQPVGVSGSTLTYYTLRPHITNADTDIQTGTPTNINSYLTATRTEVHKSGNVVHVNLKFTILSGWNNTASTQICKLPWLPSTTYPWLSRMAGPSTDSSDHYMSSSYIDTAGYICLGEGPYTGVTAGNNIWLYGTYMTND